MSELSGQLTRCILRLSEYEFEVKYNPGKINNQADALSRLRILSPITDLTYFEEISTNEDSVSEYKYTAYDEKLENCQ